MEAAGIRRRRVQRVADAHRHFVAGHDGLEHPGWCCLGFFGQGQRGGDHYNARVQRGLGRDVVELDGVGSGAVGHGCPDRRGLLVRADDRGATRSAEVERDRGSRRTRRLAAARERHADQVQQQLAGARFHVVVELRPLDRRAEPRQQLSGRARRGRRRSHGDRATAAFTASRFRPRRASTAQAAGRGREFPQRGPRLPASRAHASARGGTCSAQGAGWTRPSGPGGRAVDCSLTDVRPAERRTAHASGEAVWT